MKTIPLNRGYVAQCDDEDYPFLMHWKWGIMKKGNLIYARRATYFNNKQTIYLMHRVLMLPPDNIDIDHMDGNGLNCQRYNMRNATHGQNMMNNHSKTGKSNYKGVTYIKGKYIQANISFNGNRIYLGVFPTEIEAAEAYDEAAKKYYKEFANLNFKNNAQRR